MANEDSVWFVVVIVSMAVALIPLKEAVIGTVPAATAVASPGFACPVL
jgi:hypothetical protein